MSTRPPRQPAGRTCPTHILIALLIAIVAATTSFSGASAQSHEWERHLGGSSPGGSYFGTFKNAEGTVAICALDGAKFGPGHPAGGTETATVYSDPYPVTRLRPQRYDGTYAPAISGRAIHELAYVMATFADAATRRDAVAADLATIRIAGAELDWQGYEIDRIAAGASARADEMVAQARENAGPYTAEQPVITLAKNGRSGSVTAIGVRAGDGQWLAGYPWEATIQGTATWSNGARTISGRTDDEGVQRAIRATGAGEVSVRVSVAGLPDALHRMDPVNGGSLAQHLLPAGRTQQVQARSRTTQIVMDFAAQARTTVTSRYVKEGDQLADEVTASAAKGDWVIVAGQPVPVTFTGTLYGPYAQPRAEQADVPDDAPVVDRTKLTFAGPSTQVSEAFTATAPGFYTWVWTMRRAEQPPEIRQYLRGNFTAPFFEFAETHSAQHRAGATSQVAPEDAVVLPGDSVTDIVTLSGFPSDHTEFVGTDEWASDQAQVTHRLYGPFVAQPSKQNPIDLKTAPVVGEIETPAVNGAVSVTFEGERAPAQVGHYVIVTSFDGDARVAPWQTSPYDPAEMFRVAAPPVVRTQAQADALIGAPFHDTAQIRDPGGVLDSDDGWAWSVEFATYLAGDVAPLEVDSDGAAMGDVPDEVTQVCAGEPLAEAAVEITGAGSYNSPAVTTDSPGGVFWVERLVRTHPEHGREQVAEGVCGLPNETTMVRPMPLVITQATEVVEPGAPMEDVATVTDPSGALAMPGYRWHLVFEAFGPTKVAPLEVTADGVPSVTESGHLPRAVTEMCAREPLFRSDPVPVDGPGNYRSGPALAPGVGNVFWVETLVAVPESGDPITTEGLCGLPNETTAVGQPVNPGKPDEPQLANTGMVAPRITQLGLIAGLLATGGACLVTGGRQPCSHPLPFPNATSGHRNWRSRTKVDG